MRGKKGKLKIKLNGPLLLEIIFKIHLLFCISHTYFTPSFTLNLFLTKKKINFLPFHFKSKDTINI